MKLDMDNLYQSTMRLLVPLSVDKSYKTIIDEAKGLVGADFGSIFLVQGKNLKKVYSTVPKGYQGTPRKKGYTYQALTTQKPLVVNHKEFSSIHPKFTKSKVKCVIIIPLSYDNKVIGVVSLWSNKNRHFSSI